MGRLGMRYEREILRPGLVDGRVGVQPQAPFALYRTRRPVGLAAPTQDW
jgi:hypothetical protein